MLFSDYTKMWMRDCHSNSSESYIVDQKRTLRLHISPFLDQKPFFEISAGDISEVMNASRSRSHSEQTQLYIYTTMHKIFSDAIEFHELERKNPVKRKFHRPRTIKKKAKFFHPDTSAIVLEYVLGSMFERLVWIQMFTGMRVSEALMIKWKHVDFVNKMMLIESAYIRKTNKVQEYPKNGEQIYVPMPDRLIDFLKTRVGNPDDFVSPNTKGAMICYYVYRRYLRVMKLRLKLEFNSTHIFRHSCTEMWKFEGATLQDFKNLLNQKSSKSAEAYNHRTDDRLIAMARNVGKKLEIGCIVVEKRVVNE